MANDKWITIEELILALRADAGVEHQCCRGWGILRSTHWMRYDPDTDMFGDTTSWLEYDWYTEAEMLFLRCGWWLIEY